MYTIDNLVKIDLLLGEWEPPLAEFVYEFVTNDSTGHDIYHCLRVKRLALRLSEGEGLDREIMVATAYLHDIGRERERQGQGDHVNIGMAAAQELLPTLAAFPAAKIEAVIRCIEYHEEYEWARSRAALDGDVSREIRGFQDADRLDAIGAIGLARMFTFGGSYRQPLWFPEIKPGHWQHGSLGSSTYNHLYEKLLKLKDTMNTQTGRQLAEARHCFMEQFATEFEDEWFGRI
ncbi:MAG: HD domain-containing protein [Chloroflexota bacterium]